MGEAMKRERSPWVGLPRKADDNVPGGKGLSCSAEGGGISVLAAKLAMIDLGDQRPNRRAGAVSHPTGPQNDRLRRIADLRGFVAKVRNGSLATVPD